ncbi:MAG: RodZ family helix-turn-helix domain-containing protein [Pseudomonadota bacterium]|nr:RodZ family helix-turn-helix domain-containing protein [Pseudomonadota bacterium]
MNAQPVPGHEEENTPELMDSPGRRLRVARQARGLEVEQLAAELHLGPSLIEALERDDYDVLPGSVFIVGYFRNYARVVGLDPEPLVDAYRSARPGTEPAGQRVSSPRTRQQVRSGNLLVRLASLAIVAVIAALAFVWWQGQSRIGDAILPEEDSVADVVAEEAQRGDPEPAVAISTEGVLTAPAPRESSQTTLVAAEPQEPQEPPVEPAANQTTTVTEPASQVVEAEPPTEDAAVEADAEPAGAAQEDTAGAEDAGETVIEFSGPCWVDIRDSERKFKLFGEMRKGDRHVLEGSPPYSVILGNAAAVKITVAGKPFALDDIAHGNVARFTLDPKQQP